MDAETVTLVLELRIDGESIAGSAADSVGAVRKFVGWLGLVAAIDALLSQRIGTNFGRER